MRLRFFQCLVPVALAFGTVLGCGKSSSGDAAKSAPPKPAPVPQTVAQVHWLGSRSVLSQSNAAAFAKLSALPEAARLVAQVVDKLSLGLARGWPDVSSNLVVWVTNYPALLATNQTAALLRPLLQDVLEQEVLLEVRSLEGRPGELVLAVRIDDPRATLWATNLAMALEHLSGASLIAARSNSTSLHCVLTNSPWKWSSAPQHVDLERVGGWTLLGLAPEANRSLKDLAARIQTGAGSTPVPARGTNYWVETTLDLAGLSSALSLGWNLPQQMPKFWLAAVGRGEDVLTVGRFTFDTAFATDLPAWNIPTNLIHEPLHSFTAIRGLGAWLSAQALWKDLKVVDAPNQLFTWTQTGTPFLDYFAAPMIDASNAVDAISERLMQVGNPILASNRMGSLERSTNFHGLAWNQAPVFNPFLKVSRVGDYDYVGGGLASAILTNSPPPEVTLNEVFNGGDLIYFDSEITAARLEALMYVGQLSRLILRRPQIPGDFPAFSFFKASVPNLAASKTTLRLIDPKQLSLERTSSLGFTALELHILTEWLESPRFPRGLHGILVSLPPLPVRRAPQAPTPGAPK